MKISKAQKIKNRQSILDAFVILSKGKKFKEVSMKAIAKSAGLSDAAIYNYFASKEELITAIKTVNDGKMYLDKTANEIVINTMTNSKKNKDSESLFPKLSRREKEVLVLIINEHTTQEIADKLCFFVSYNKLLNQVFKTKEEDSLKEFNRLIINGLLLRGKLFTEEEKEIIIKHFSEFDFNWVGLELNEIRVLVILKYLNLINTFCLLSFVPCLLNESIFCSHSSISFKMKIYNFMVNVPLRMGLQARVLSVVQYVHKTYSSRSRMTQTGICS